MALPYRLLQVGGRFQKRNARSIENEPGQNQTGQRQTSGQEAAEDAASRPAFVRHQPEASGAEQPRLVLNDAFAAIRPAALRAAADSLAVFVVPAALLEHRGSHRRSEEHTS